MEDNSDVESEGDHTESEDPLNTSSSVGSSQFSIPGVPPRLFVSQKQLISEYEVASGKRRGATEVEV